MAGSARPRSAPAEPGQGWLSVEQAAWYTGKSIDLINEACRLHEIEHVEKGGRRERSFTRAMLDAWMMKDVRRVEVSASRAGRQDATALA